MSFNEFSKNGFTILNIFEFSYQVKESIFLT